MKTKCLYLFLATGSLAVILTACSPMFAGIQTNETVTPAPTLQMTVPPAVVHGPGQPGTFEPTACRFALPEDPVQKRLLQEGVDVECGYVVVSEDYGNPQGRRIRLAVAIFHRPGGAIYPDPVIYLSGGPGMGRFKSIRYQYEVMTKPVFAAGRDLVLFDQRGVGLSRPALECPEYTEVTLELLDQQVDGQPVDEQQAKALMLDSLRTCREFLSQTANLSMYNSAANADDVEVLRQALGFAEVNLWGGSYGTRLGLEVLRRHPEHLRSVVLEAVYPPDVDLISAALGNFSRSLELLFDDCAANPICSQNYPELRAVFFSTIAKLDADPVAFQLIDLSTGIEYPAQMDGGTLLSIVFQVLYDSDLRYLLPKLIYAANEGNFTVFERFRSSMVSMMKLTSRGMMFSVHCHDEVPFSSPQALVAEVVRYPELKGMYRTNPHGTMMFDLCQVWDVGSADASANQPVSSDRPVMILNGEFDPITPPAWGLQAAKTLPNAFVFEYPGIGHGAISVADCPANMFTEFLLDPITSPDAVCIEAMK